MAMAYLRRVIADLTRTQESASANDAIIRELSTAYYALAALKEL
jgi:hypothetical protein